MGCPQLLPMSDAWLVAPPRNGQCRLSWRALRGLNCSQVSLFSSASTCAILFLSVPGTERSLPAKALAWHRTRHRQAGGLCLGLPGFEICPSCFTGSKTAWVSFPMAVGTPLVAVFADRLGNCGDVLR